MPDLVMVAWFAASVLFLVLQQGLGRGRYRMREEEQGPGLGAI